jgi:hypothetical protein
MMGGPKDSRRAEAAVLQHQQERPTSHPLGHVIIELYQGRMPQRCESIIQLGRVLHLAQTEAGL